jgi:hypothetical protein
VQNVEEAEIKDVRLIVCGAYSRTPHRDNRTSRSPRLRKLPAEGMCGCAAVVTGHLLSLVTFPRWFHRRPIGEIVSHMVLTTINNE